MRKFYFYVELESGKIPSASKKKIERYIDLLFDCEITFVWLFNECVVTYPRLKSIVYYERKICDKKGFVLKNLVSSLKISLLAKMLMKKYKFTVSKAKEQQIDNDYVRASFMNVPHSCDFNSCLGTTLVIHKNGDLNICPFINNSISLNENLEIKDIREVFNTESFIELMQNNVSKRRKCKVECNRYAFCKGGCPLMQSDVDCSIRSAMDTVQSEMSKKSLKDDDYREQCIEKISSMYKV